jgi:hypothetical protein
MARKLIDEILYGPIPAGSIVVTTDPEPEDTPERAQARAEQYRKYFEDNAEQIQVVMENERKWRASEAVYRYFGI